MYRNNKLSLAVSIALGVSFAGSASAAIEEVIVTATKRAENMQDVAIAISALGGDALKELNVQSFDEYVEYLPNVVSAGTGPGAREIYIRGSASEQGSVTVSSAQGSAPGVALYLDDMPVSFGARNLDLYAADLQRVEVLAGPQGTLFGASSQSGTVRMITNKPVIGEFEGRIDLGISSTAGGADSNKMEAMINLPLSESVALRMVSYSDRQGGWIDNVPSTFTPNGEVIDRNDLGYGPRFANYPNTTVQSISNADLVEEDWNEATYNGYRIGLAADINEDWSVLVQHASQELDVEGSFLIDPRLGDESSAKYSPERTQDDFGLTTWTLEGRVSNLDVVYTGGYLDREVDAVVDYTHYNNGGAYVTYYMCSGGYSSSPSEAQNSCFDPTKQYLDTSSNERTTHEFRLSTDADNRLRLLGGIYFNDVETKSIGEFQYFGAGDAFSEFNQLSYGNPDYPAYQLGNVTVDTAGTNAGTTPRGPNTVFYNDFTRSEEEIAFFGEIAFDVTDQLTASVSFRKYELDTELQGASNFSFGCRYNGAGVPVGATGTIADQTVELCTSESYSNDVSARFDALGAYGANGDDAAFLALTSPAGDRDMFRGGATGSNQKTLDAINSGKLDISDINSDGSTTEKDTIVKVSVDYHLTDDIMLYGVYSEGYRPATQNRNAGRSASRQVGVYEGYLVPAVAVTDTLENIEFGMKGTFLDNTLRFNATYYQADIENLQVSRFDPSNVAFLVFMENVGDAESSGIDADFQWAASDRLTISGAFSVLSTEITRVNDQLVGIAVPVGSDLPLSSDFSGNLRARYDFTLDNIGADAFVSASMTYRGETLAGIVGSAAFMDDTGSLVYGAESGVERSNEGGTFGAVNDSNGGLPLNSRFVNEAATTLNASVGMSKDSWKAEFFVKNITSEEGAMTETAGKFTAEQSVMRPRTMGLRFSYNFQ
jgi:iron complex outermembrane receptor protein|tara:strand:- start:2025 stop:4850 length:2826 start_codon:yes stop_codon:yes gene_type:complete